MTAIRLPILCAALLIGAVAVIAGGPTGAAARRDPSGSGAAATDPLSKANRLPASLEEKVQRLRADLETNGYEVARGYWRLWAAEDCKYPLQTIGFCYGNNPAAPYVAAVLPHWDDEIVDQRFHHAFFEGRRNMSSNYRLGEREALVVLAELPPPARYFGIGTNVFTRQDTINELDKIYRLPWLEPQMRSILFAVTPDPSRMMMFASIGNTVNNVVIERQSGQVWSQQRFFVITPDESLAASITAALGGAGVPASDVFTEPVAPDLVRLGYGQSADDLVTYIRYALPDDRTKGDQWRAQLPLTVLRVRDTRASEAEKPFPIPAYEPKIANYDETELEDDLGALMNAVLAHWNQSINPKPFVSLFTVIDLVGQHCLGYPDPDRGPMDCLGDNQDTDYQVSPTVQIDDGQVIAMVGTLATQTGNATYVSLSVNRFSALVGVENIDDTDLDGSAEPFSAAAALQHDPDLFYVYYMARDCTGLGPYCVEVPRKLVSVGATIKIIQRNYVNPGDGSPRGPNPTKVLNPYIIVLDGSKRPITE